MASRGWAGSVARSPDRRGDYPVAYVDRSRRELFSANELTFVSSGVGANTTYERRTHTTDFLKAGSAAVAGTGLLASASTPALAGEDYANSDKDAVVPAPTDAGAVLAALNQYPSYDGEARYGTLIEGGAVRRNAHLNWSGAMYVLLAESHERGAPYGLAPER